MKEVAHTLVLPAVVEADPARTVKVMPPVTGRVIDLMAQLGGRVVMGEELAVIDSERSRPGDLRSGKGPLRAQARQADPRPVDGAREDPAIAVKEREQAQSDFAQAQSELERADARLRAIGVPVDQKASTRLLSVKAPMSGSVIDLQVAPGALISTMPPQR